MKFVNLAYLKFLATTWFLLLVIVSLIAQPNLPANGDLYIDTEVPRVDILIDTAALDAIYANVWSNFEHPATFIYTSSSITDTIENVGFRLRGNTSRNASKKSFKVSFNTFDSEQKYKGVEKINLNGNHNDPTLIRPKLCFDLFRALEIPASRSNFVELYINNSYYGLYANIEHIDEQFVDSRFNNNAGNLYKCTWPADLQYLGTNPANYDVDQYELITNEIANDRNDLAEFIIVLNNTPIIELPCALDPIFNVQDYLKCMAVDIMIGNWDGPLYNKNNFYLYKNAADGRFEYIPYDLDNTLGLDWLGEDWGNRNIFNWYNGNESRALYKRIIQVPEYRTQFNQYVQQIAALFLSNNFQEQYSINLKTLIEPYAINDVFRVLDYGYTISDFQNAFIEPLNGGSFHDDQYGLISFLITRANSALQQADNNTGIPYLNYLDWEGGYLNDSLTVTIKMNGPSDNTVLIKAATNLMQNTITLYDDGLLADEFANDSIYTYKMPITSAIDSVSLSFEIIDNNNQTQLFTYPACNESRSIIFNESQINLVINEFMASNENAKADEYGEYDDWFEIYNTGNNTVNLSDVYITDNFKRPFKFNLPNQILVPGDFVLVWADEDQSQGDLHCNFKLKAAGEEIALFEKVNDHFLPIDLLRYENAETDLSYGYYPEDGIGEIVELPFISPENSNSEMLGFEDLSEDKVLIYPNPFKTEIYIESNTSLLDLKVYNSVGQLVLQTEQKSRLNLESLNNGIYYLSVNDEQLIKILKTN